MQHIKQVWTIFQTTKIGFSFLKWKRLQKQYCSTSSIHLSYFDKSRLVEQQSNKTYLEFEYLEVFCEISSSFTIAGDKRRQVVDIAALISHMRRIDSIALLTTSARSDSDSVSIDLMFTFVLRTRDEEAVDFLLLPLPFLIKSYASKFAYNFSFFRQSAFRKMFPFQNHSSNTLLNWKFWTPYKALRHSRISLKICHQNELWMVFKPKPRTTRYIGNETAVILAKFGQNQNLASPKHLISYGYDPLRKTAVPPYSIVLLQARGYYCTVRLDFWKKYCTELRTVFSRNYGALRK